MTRHSVDETTEILKCWNILLYYLSCGLALEIVREGASQQLCSAIKNFNNYFKSTDDVFAAPKGKSSTLMNFIEQHKAQNFAPKTVRNKRNQNHSSLLLLLVLVSSQRSVNKKAHFVSVMHQLCQLSV